MQCWNRVDQKQFNHFLFQILRSIRIFILMYTSLNGEVNTVL